MEARVCRLYKERDLRIEREQVSAIEEDEVLVRVEKGGICGSDLHYYLHGGFGPIRVKEPIILGHEFAGKVAAVGAAVEGLEIGDHVAVSPSQPCGECEFCQRGIFQHCYEMRFLGSAMRMPHEQGGFRDYFVASARQCIKAANKTDIAELACTEPLAVCLHAASRVQLAKEQSVFINGAGPIGSLCVAVAKHLGIGHVVVADLFDKTLETAKALGADETINLQKDAASLEKYAAGKGHFDVIFECSAAQAAMKNIFRIIKPQGTIVQVGVGGETAFPLNMMVGKEVSWMGTHRFHPEYRQAVELIDSKKIDVRPIITHTFPVGDALKALETAADRSQSVKVQLDFTA